MVLLARWKLNEDPASHGSTLSDSSENSYDMTLYTNDGTTNKSVTGKYDKAIDFDGVNDYAKVTTQIVNNPTALTVCGWFKKESGGSTYECVLHHGTTNTIGSTAYWFGVDLNDDLCATIGANTSGGSWSMGLTTTRVTYGTWYHLMAIWDGSVVKVYINNVYNKQYNLTSYTNINFPTRIGASSDGSHYQLRGAVEDVRIYNHALSESERQEVYDYGLNIVGPFPTFRRG